MFCSAQIDLPKILSISLGFHVSFLFCGNGTETQGLVHARLVLYH